MINSIKQFLNDYNLINKKNIYLVAFSGGYDSMCLLDILKKISENYPFDIIAIHLNHNWRGEESQLEQQICEFFCKEKSIQFYAETIPDYVKKTETSARDYRYSFFEKCLKKFNASAIFTAHNKNDNIETVLYRIAKGTGIKGLCGISEKRNNIYRPLLKISRENIEQYCKNNNLSPNNDSSNTNTKYFRNFIRHNVINLLKKINPNLDNAICSLIEIANENEQIGSEYMELVKDKVQTNNGTFLTEKFQRLSTPLQKKVIYELLIENNIEYTRTKITEILEFIKESSESKSGKKKSLTKNLWLYVSNKEISVISESIPCEKIIKINKEGIFNFNEKIFELKKISTTPDIFPKDNEFMAYIELNEPINLELRTRMIGDKIQPLGCVGTMKLKKYLISKNIPKHERDNILLLCDKNEILWVSGIGLSEKIKVVKKATHVLKLNN